MDYQFWHRKWEDNEIGFHRDEVNPLLIKYWPKLNLGKAGHVLVPLCGKSLDMIWLSEQGYSVLGVELSSIAVESFFKENNLSYQIIEKNNFTSWKSGKIEILCGDFFDIDIDTLANVRAVYDRASMIALSRDFRKKYYKLMLTLLPEDVVMLLVTLEYPEGEMEGPPYSVISDEIESAYHSRFKIEQVHDENVLDNDPFFREKGLTKLHEMVYLLT